MANTWLYTVSILAISFIAGGSHATSADTVMGAGLGATTGGSTVTSTTQQPDEHMSGTANIGNATSTNGVLSSTPPSHDNMVAPDFPDSPSLNRNTEYPDKHKDNQ